jgi:cytochrome bd ubiquinol oxidase subunit I
VSSFASTTVDLARLQFGLTSIYHFLFVPLTLGLAPLVACMQTLWHRSHDDAWLRLTRFFGTLLLINFAIGVATGLVQEFQFGMSWAAYSNFVGGVFGAPLAIEGLAAFMVEATFLGVWIFGWDQLSPRVHLATIWIAALATWLSAYFILTANSWMQRPVGYEIVDGKAQLTSVWELLSNSFALFAWVHVILAGLIFGSMVMLGVACWHFLRGRNVELFRRAAMLALIVALPATLIQLSVGNRFGAAVTSAQGMKIAASEAQWNTCQPCGFSVFQIGGFTKEDPDPSFSITIPRLLSWMATGSFDGQVQGLNQLQAREQKQFGPGDYMPRVRLMYWSMRTMAMLGVAMFLIAAVGAWLYRRRRLEQARWFQRIAIVAIAFPYIAATAGWILTEMGRQPWIVQDLLKTSDAVSPNLSTATIATSLGAFALLYLTLGIVDFVLMRRYARVDPPHTGEGGGLGAAAGAPAPTAAVPHAGG